MLQNYFLDYCIIIVSLKKICSKKKKKNIFLSVLKSPHVNKISQEQFSEKLYNTQISIYAQNYLVILLFLKNLNTFFLSDVKLKLSFFLVEHYSFLDQQKVKLACKKNSLYVNIKDILGEQNFSFNSSEVEHRTENP